MYTQTIQSERSRESAMFQQFCSRNPEDLLSNAQQASTKDMAREYDAKQALVAMYQAKADRRNIIVERHDANSRSVDRELFFKVSPV